MSTLVIEPTNKHDTEVDIEEKLQKAVDTLQMQRENKQFPDVFLRARKDKADKVVDQVFNSMIEEIAGVILEGE